MSVEILSRELEAMRKAICDAPAQRIQPDFYPRDLCDALGTCLETGLTDEVMVQLPVPDFGSVMEYASQDGLESYKMWAPLLQLMRALPLYREALTDGIVSNAITAHVLNGQIQPLNDLGQCLIDSEADWAEPVETGLAQGLYYLASNRLAGVEYLQFVVDYLNQPDHLPGMAIFTPHVETSLTKAVQAAFTECWDKWDPERRGRLYNDLREAVERYPVISQWLNHTARIRHRTQLRYPPKFLKVIKENDMSTPTAAAFTSAIQVLNVLEQIDKEAFAKLCGDITSAVIGQARELNQELGATTWVLACSTYCNWRLSIDAGYQDEVSIDLPGGQEYTLSTPRDSLALRLTDEKGEEEFLCSEDWEGHATHEIELYPAIGKIILKSGYETQKKWSLMDGDQFDYQTVQGRAALVQDFMTVLKAAMPRPVQTGVPAAPELAKA